MLKRIGLLMISLTIVAGVILATGCGKKAASGDGENKDLKGSINIDGSSTVYPISSAVAEEFAAEANGVKINVGQSGTGGGMKKFYSGTLDICDASRPISDKEKEECKKNNIEYTEYKVAQDGITIVVNKDNTWAKSMTVEQLKKMWSADSKVKTWKDIDPSWPDAKISFYSPGSDSGTFEFFTEAICGKKGSIRKDITPSEDDNVLVKGVEGDKNAIAYFGYAYYKENKTKVNDVKVDAGKGAIEPTVETIKSGSYAPLSRPLFIYVNNSKQKEEHVKAFLKYYFEKGPKISEDVGYISLDKAVYDESLNKIK